MRVTTTNYFVNQINIILTDNEVKFPNIRDISVEIRVFLCLSMSMIGFQPTSHTKWGGSTTDLGPGVLYVA